MKLQAFLLITFLGLAGASAGLAQDDAAPAAPSNEESAAVDSGNAGSAAAEPAAESAAESAAAPAAAPAAKDAAPAAAKAAYQRDYVAFGFVHLSVQAKG